MARIAVLDANVLWPQYLRDALIRAAIADVYRAAWTECILDEMRNSVIRRGRASSDQIDRTVQFMRQNCPHFMVEGYERLIPVMTNDEKDRHVLAAAIVAGADTIVTSNVKDFPPASRAVRHRSAYPGRVSHRTMARRHRHHGASARRHGAWTQETAYDGAGAGWSATREAGSNPCHHGNRV